MCSRVPYQSLLKASLAEDFDRYGNYAVLGSVPSVSVSALRAEKPLKKLRSPIGYRMYEATGT